MPYVVIIVAAIIIDFAINSDVAWVVSTLGTVLVLFGQGLYAGYDSRQRWPGLTFTQRLGRIFTFQR
jgi:hypothetical protein